LFFTKNGIVQLLLFELKYKQNKRAGLLLGNTIGWALKKANRFNEIDFLIPIPIRKITERTRGYNQSLLICEGIAQVFPIAILPTVLFKNKKTNTQTRKDRIERGQNTDHLFGLKNPDQIREKRLLLVDDIITTGATAESAGRCLLQANPASIQFAAAAYTLS
jgi:ComF family protein